jgi:hypothetical protein
VLGRLEVLLLAAVTERRLGVDYRGALPWLGPTRRKAGQNDDYFITASGPVATA